MSKFVFVTQRSIFGIDIKKICIIIEKNLMSWLFLPEVAISFHLKWGQYYTYFLLINLVLFTANECSKHTFCEWISMKYLLLHKIKLKMWLDDKSVYWIVLKIHQILERLSVRIQMNFTPHLFANRAVKGTFKDSNPNLIALKYNCEQEIWVRAIISPSFFPNITLGGSFHFVRYTINNFERLRWQEMRMHFRSWYTAISFLWLDFNDIQSKIDIVVFWSARSPLCV